MELCNVVCNPPQTTHSENTKSKSGLTPKLQYGGRKWPRPHRLNAPHWSTMPGRVRVLLQLATGLLTTRPPEPVRQPGPETTSAELYGYLQGACLEGKHVGECIAACLVGDEGRPQTL